MIEQALMAHRAALYTMFYNMANEGLTLREARAQVNIPVETLRTLRSRFPQELEQIAQEAAHDAIEVRREELRALSQAKIQAQIATEQQILSRREEVVAAILGQAEKGSAKAAMLVTRWIQSGFTAIPHVEGIAEEEPTRLTFDPRQAIPGTLRPVRQVTEFAGGTTVTIETQDDLIVDEVPCGTPLPIS